jgi:hypothetical protein
MVDRLAAVYSIIDDGAETVGQSLFLRNTLCHEQEMAKELNKAKVEKR